MAASFNESPMDIYDENLRSCSDPVKELAFEDLQEEIRLAKDSIAIGNKFIRQKCFHVAFHYFTNAINNYSQNPNFYCKHSMCNLYKKLYFRSFEDACKAIDLDPLEVRGFHCAINVLANSGVTKLIREVANMALEFVDKDNRKAFSTLTEDYYSKSTLQDDQNTANVYALYKRRLRKMPNFNQIRDINRKLKIKDYGRVFKMCHELLDDPRVPTVANAYYYSSLCYQNLQHKELAYNTLNMCLYLSEYHNPAKRFMDYLNEFYNLKENGFLCFIKSEYEDCEKWYKKWFNLNNGNKFVIVQYHFVMGLTKMATKNYDRAKSCLTKAIAVQENFTQAFYMRGMCYQQLSDKTSEAKAQSDFNRAAELFKIEKNSGKLPRNSSIEESFISKAATYLRAGRFDTGIEFYKLAFMCRPKDFQTVRKCSEALMKVHQYDEVLHISKRVRNLAPNDGLAYLEEGKCLIVLGWAEEAICVLAIALKLLPKNREVQVIMGRALRLNEFLKRGKKAADNENLEAAEMYFTEAHVIAHANTNILSDIAECQSRLRNSRNTSQPTIDLEGIVRHANESNQIVDDGMVNLIPDAGISYVQGTLAYYKLQKEDALTHFRTVMQLDPNNTSAHASILLVERVFQTYDDAHSLLSKGDFINAERLFKVGITIDKNNHRVQAMFHYGLGETYFEMGLFQFAVIEYTYAIRWHNEYSDAYARRGQSLCCLNHFQEGIEDFRCAIELVPTKSDIARHYFDFYKYAQKELQVIQKQKESSKDR